MSALGTSLVILYRRLTSASSISVFTLLPSESNSWPTFTGFDNVPALAAFYGTAAAQEIVYDFSGQPVLLKKYEEYKGSPFWYDQWKKGILRLKDGRAFKDMDMKYDIVGEQVVFERSGVVLRFNDPVSEFTLGNELFRSGYQAADGRTEQSFYQVISDGNVQFLKRINKTVTENKPYGSATLQKEFTSSEGYYIARGKQLRKVRKDKRSIFEALGNRSAELEQFAASKKLNLKDDADIALLVNYYNSL